MALIRGQESSKTGPNDNGPIYENGLETQSAVPDETPDPNTHNNYLKDALTRPVKTTGSAKPRKTGKNRCLGQTTPGTPTTISEYFPI